MRWTMVVGLVLTVHVVNARGDDPVFVTDLDSSAVAGMERPRLSLRRAQVEEIRAWTQTPDGKAALDRYLEQAEADLTIEPPVLETAWWAAIKDKPWHETYPPIFRHTFTVPSPAALAAQRLARAWRVTGEAKYAEKAQSLLLHYRPYTFEYEHYDVGMNYAIWATALLGAYDLLFDRLTEDERRDMDAFFSRFVAAVLKNDAYWLEHDIGGGINNHLAWHKYGVGMAGLFFGLDDLVDLAQDSELALLPLLELGTVDDGLWCESSLNYHFTAIVPMFLFADALRACGYPRDIYTLTAANGRMLEQPMNAMFGVLFPDGSIPPVGDSYARKGMLADIGLYRQAYRAWGDPRVAWLLARKETIDPHALLTPVTLGEPRAPDARTALYPEHGYVFLRNRQGADYWDNPDAACVFLTYDRTGVHANRDGLSMMLFARGRLLLPDCEAKASADHAFSSDVQSTLNRTSLCHNLVLVDGMEQRPHDELLDLVEFRSLDSVQSTTLADLRGQLVEGVRQMRTVHLTDGYLLDVYQVRSASDHTWQYLVHAMDPWLEDAAQWSGSAVNWRESPMPNADPWRWLRDWREAVASGDWSMTWTQGAESLRVAVAGDGITTLRRWTFPRTDTGEDAGIPMLAVERSGRSATFAAVYTWGPEPAAASVVRAGETEGRLRYRVTVDGQTREFFAPVLP